MGAALWFALISMFVVTMIVLFAGSRKAGKRVADSNFDSAANDAIGELADYNKKAQLEERTDSEVGDLLDACAKEFKEISTCLESDVWNTEESLRKEAKVAATQAQYALMGDALVLGMSGVRATGARRDAFSKRMSDPKIKEPLLNSIGQALKNLRVLRSEISDAANTDKENTDAFRTALARLEEIRKAEEELRTTIG